MRIDIKPMSVNRCWQGRRFRTPEFRQWQRDVQTLLTQYNGARFGKEGIEVSIIFYERYPIRGDIDNKVKPILDCLVEAGIIGDDRYIFKLIIEKEKADQDFFTFNIKKYNV